MTAELKRIKVTRDGEVARLLDEAAKTPLLLEKDGVFYRLHREEQEGIRAEYASEKVMAAVDLTAGSWADIDADALIAELYRAREEGSRPANRPNALSA